MYVIRRSFSKLAIVYFLLNFMYTVPMISVQFQWITTYAMRVDTFSYLKGFIFIPWALKPLFAFIPKHRAIIAAVDRTLYPRSLHAHPHGRRRARRLAVFI